MTFAEQLAQWRDSASTWVAANPAAVVYGGITLTLLALLTAGARRR